MKKILVYGIAVLVLLSGCGDMTKEKGKNGVNNEGDSTTGGKPVVVKQYAVEFDAKAFSPEERNLSKWVQNTISYTDKDGAHENKIVLGLAEMSNGTIVVRSAPFSFKAAPHPFKVTFPVLKKNLQKTGNSFVFNKTKGEITVLYASPPAYMTGTVDFVTPSCSENFEIRSDGLGGKMQIKIELSNPQKYEGDAKLW